MHGGFFRTALALVLIALVCGCSSGKRMARDERFAREMLGCIYEGSLSPLKDSIHRYYRLQMPDWVTAALSEVMKEECGRVKDVRFASTRELERGAVSSVWQITGEKSGCQMKIVFDESGRVIYLSFRPSDKEAWKPAAQMAREYIRKQTSGQTPG